MKTERELLVLVLDGLYDLLYALRYPLVPKYSQATKNRIADRLIDIEDALRKEGRDDH